MKLAKVKSGSRIIETVFKDNNYYEILEGDFFNIINISKNPLQNIEEILPPIMPSKIIGAGLNYKLHVKEFETEIPKNPIIFIKPNTTIIGNDDNIIIPKDSQRVDCEAELAIVIVKECRNIKAEDAENYILGFTCLNDVTARDIQKIDVQWSRAKSYDTFCPIGPYIETDLEYNNLKIQARLNNKIVQDDNTSNMICKIPNIIEHISSVMTLNKGDIIATGTPAGITPMNNGDIIEIEIKGIGILKNFVKDI